MAAATSDREFLQADGIRTAYGIAAATQLYNGIMVANVGGYAVAATDAVGRPVLGFVDDGGDLDNSAGLAAALDVQVVHNRACWMDNDTVNPVVVGDVGKSCYVEDNKTVRTFTTGTANSRAGRVLQLDSSKGVLVYFDGGNGEAAEDFEIADDLVVGDDAAIGGDLTVTGGAALDGGATVGAGLAVIGDGDLIVGVAVGAFDLTMKLGDAAGAQVFEIVDSASAQVFEVNSDGDTTIAGDLTVTGAADISGGAQVPYAEAALGAAPSQAQMVAAFGAGVDGQIGIYEDTTGGAKQPYLCAFTTDGGGWWQLALTAVGA